MASTINMHNQLKDLFSGSGTSASSTTSMSTVFETLASDTRALLEKSNKHFMRVEKLLAENVKATKKIDGGSFTSGLISTILSGLGLGAGLKGVGKVGSILSFFNLVKREGQIAERGVQLLKGGGIFTRLFSTVKGFFSSFASIGNTIKAVGSRVAVMGASVFGMLRLDRIAGMFEGFSKFGGLFRGVVGYLPKVAGLVAKLAWPITIIMGLIDGVSGWNNASEILGRQVDGFGGRLIASIGSIVNGLFLGIPDWASQQLNFKNFASMLDEGATWVTSLGQSLFDGIMNIGNGITGYFKSIFNYFGDILGGLVTATPEEAGSKAAYLKKANSAAFKMEQVYGGGFVEKKTKEDRDAAYQPVRSIMKEGTPEVPSRADAFKKAKADSTKAAEKSPTKSAPIAAAEQSSTAKSATNIAIEAVAASSSGVISDAMGNVAMTNAEIANQLPTEMRPYMSVISGALTTASQSMVMVYANLQAKAMEEAKKEEKTWIDTFNEWFGKSSTSTTLANDGPSYDAMGNLTSPGSFSSSSSSYSGTGTASNSAGTANKSSSSAPVKTDPFTGEKVAPSLEDWSDNASLKEKSAILKREMRKELPDWSDDQIAGFIGNMQGESGLKTDINEGKPLIPGSRGGYGLMQWTGPRRRALEAYAAEMGKPPSDPGVQISFIGKEARGEIGTEKAGYDKFLSVSAGQGPEAAIAAATRYVERPAHDNSNARIAAARKSGVLDVAPAAEKKKYENFPMYTGDKAEDALKELQRYGLDEASKPKSRGMATPTTSSGGLSPEAPKTLLPKPAFPRATPTQPSAPRMPEIAAGAAQYDYAMQPSQQTQRNTPTPSRENKAKESGEKSKSVNSAGNDSQIRVRDVAPIDEYKMLAINGSTII